MEESVCYCRILQVPGRKCGCIHGTIPTSSTIVKEHAEPQRVTSNTQQATGNKESWYTLNLAKTHTEPQRVTSNTQQATGILPKHIYIYIYTTMRKKADKTCNGQAQVKSPVTKSYDDMKQWDSSEDTTTRLSITLQLEVGSMGREAGNMTWTSFYCRSFPAVPPHKAEITCHKKPRHAVIASLSVCLWATSLKCDTDWDAYIYIYIYTYNIQYIYI